MDIRGIAGFAVSAEDAEMQAIVQAAVQAAIAAVQARKGPHAAPAEPVRKLCFAEMWASFRVYGEVHIPSWQNCQRSHEKRVLAFWGRLAWDECTPEMEDKFRAQLRAEITMRKTPTSAGYRNRIMNSVKGCLEWHARRRPPSIPYNPLRGTKEEKGPTMRDFGISDDQFRVIISAAPPLLRLVLVVLFETGCRRDEIRLLEWAEVNGEKRTIELPAERTKAKRPRSVPLSDVAWQAIQMAPRLPGARYVFANHRNGGPLPKTTLGDMFRATRARAGIKGPRGQDIWMHTLRHSWASLQAASGLPLMKLMDMGGWSDPKVAQRYQNMSDEMREQTRKHLDSRRPLEKVEALSAALTSPTEDDDDAEK